MTPRTSRHRHTRTHLPPTTHTRPSPRLLRRPRAPGPDPHVPTHIDGSPAPSCATTTTPSHGAPPHPLPSPPSHATAPSCATLPPPLPSMRSRRHPTCRPPHHVSHPPTTRLPPPHVPSIAPPATKAFPRSPTTVWMHLDVYRHREDLFHTSSHSLHALRCSVQSQSPLTLPVPFLTPPLALTLT